MSMRAAVLLNGAAGGIAGDQTLTRVREAFAASSVSAHVQSVDHAALPAAARQAAASGVDVVVLGGGDGTVSAGAAALVGGSKALGILPLGTLNHFAKDAGVPLELEAAVAAIGAGHVTEVDVGEVNGHVFLNNSSVGLYPTAVHDREELRHHGGGGKWLAMAKASLGVLRRFPLLQVGLELDDEVVGLETPFIFVGNNRYAMDLFSLGSRESLQDGSLSVYLSRNAGRAGLVRLAGRALVGRLEQDRDFHSFEVRHATIRTGRSSLQVSLDGEVVRLRSPLHYSIRPRALRVLVPAPKPEPAS